MQNKPNLRNAKMDVKSLVTMIYEKMDTWLGGKTKPIQTQFKANISQNKPNLTQYKANSNPILRLFGCQFRTILTALTIICVTAILAFLSFYIEKC